MEPSIAALGSIPSYLLTNRDEIQSLDDFTEKDRIAVPATVVGFQPPTLQIAAAERYGNDQFQRFDPISISRTPPLPCSPAARRSARIFPARHFSTRLWKIPRCASCSAPMTYSAAPAQ